MRVVSNGNIYYNEDTSNIYGSKIIKKLLKNVLKNKDKSNDQAQTPQTPLADKPVAQQKKAMSKGLKIALIAGGSLVLAVGIYLIARKKK